MRSAILLFVASCSSPAAPPRPVAARPVTVRAAPLDVAVFLALPIDRHAARVVMRGLAARRAYRRQARDLARLLTTDHPAA
jgi:hypothetical protein